MTSEQERLTKLETSDSFMAKEISDIKKDIKELKDDVGDLKLAIGRWSAGLLVAFTIIQFVLQFLVE